MGIIDKFMDVMKLGYDEYDETEEILDEYEAPAPKKGLFNRSNKVNDEEEEPAAKAPKKESRKAKEVVAKPEKTTAFANKVSVVKGGKENMGSQIVSIRPMDDSAKVEIGTQLLKGKNVLINLEGLDVDIAQRVVDFTAGVCFAIKGDMKYPSKYFVLAVPNQVELTGIYEDEDGRPMDNSFNGMSFDKFQY